MLIRCILNKVVLFHSYYLFAKHYPHICRMNRKGRCTDNIYIERFWRSFKREEFYLNEYQSVSELRKAIGAYIEFYNQLRWHQSLDYKAPAQVYFSGNINQ